MEGGRGGSHGGGGRGAEGVVRLEGRAIVVRAGREARVVGRVDALWPLPLAARGDGMVAVGDALSQEVVAWRLEP